MKHVYDYVENLKPFCSPKTCLPSLSQEWTEDNPFYGHCAIITLSVYEKFGGKICRGLIAGTNISHYWNEIDEKQIDFTKTQFSQPVKIIFTNYKTKDEMLTNHNFKTRYAYFKKLIKDK